MGENMRFLLNVLLVTFLGGVVSLFYFIFREFVPSSNHWDLFTALLLISFQVIMKILPNTCIKLSAYISNSVLFRLAQSKLSRLFHFTPWWTETSLYYIRIYPLHTNSTWELANLTHYYYCLRLKAKNFLLPLLFLPLTPQ